MKSAKNNQPDYTLIAVVLVIIIFGLIMLSSASSVIAYQNYHDSNYLWKHQLFNGVLLGLAAMFIVSKIQYLNWQKFAIPMLALTIFTLFMVLVSSAGISSGGATRWIDLGFFSFQPSELAKLTFIIYLATWFSKKGKVMNDFAYGFVPFLVLLGIVTLLIMMQPDLGTMTVIALVSVAVFFIAGGSIKNISLIIVGGVSLFAILIQIAPYRAARLSVFLNPELDPLGIGYHINQALLAIGSGGILGLGLGMSRQKYNFLPEATTDSIFAIIAEELGLIISVLLIVLFVILMIRGFRIARNAPDQFGKLLAAGITCWFTIQVIINIGAMVSILPLTGIPLPFVSYGSSAIVISMIAVGILINISKHSALTSAVNTRSRR
ncbi:MAG: putative lipid II flippase FtsW [Patescibacteria group bacterium]|jgi:cell division protein FtsW